MRLWELIGAACLASAASVGCSIGRGVWPDVPAMAPREAQILACDMEGPPSFPAVDVRLGKGRVAQYGRRLMMEVSVLDESGEAVQSGSITVLWPPVDRDLLPYSYITIDVPSGEVPDQFFSCIAGMREGGRRRLVLPRTRTPPDTSTRRFLDAVTWKELRLPCEREVGIEVEMVKVSKPRIFLMTTYSIPAMRNRRVVEF